MACDLVVAKELKGATRRAGWGAKRLRGITAAIWLIGAIVPAWADSINFGALNRSANYLVLTRAGLALLTSFVRKFGRANCLLDGG